MYDAIVIGLGPSGSHFSFLAAKEGYNVLALDQKAINDEKICAGGLTPLTISILKQAYGNIPQNIIERPIKYVNIKTKYEKLLMPLSLNAFTTDRKNLDNWLIEQSIKQGVKVIYEAKVTNVKISDDSATVTYSKNGVKFDEKCHCLVIANGASGLIQNKLEINSNEHVIGIQTKIHLPSEKIDTMGNTLLFYYQSDFSHSGYAWIFPKKDHLNVGIVDRIKTVDIVEKLRKFILTEVFNLYNLTPPLQIDEIRGSLIPNGKSKKTFGDRFLVLGDAAGFADRITWEGISFALRSAAYAETTFNLAYKKEDFSEKMLSNYKKQWEKEFGKYLKFSKAIQILLSNTDRDIILRDFIKEVKHNKDMSSTLIEEFSKNMSIASGIGKLSFNQQRLLLKPEYLKIILQFKIRSVY